MCVAEGKHGYGRLRKKPVDGFQMKTSHVLKVGSVQRHTRPLQEPRSLIDSGCLFRLQVRLRMGEDEDGVVSKSTDSTWEGEE